MAVAEKDGIISIQEALEKGKGKVRLRGWCYRERKFADKVFIVLRDSSNIIQCVVKKENVPKELFSNAEKVTMESSLIVEGELVKDERAPTGYELKVSDLKIVHIAERFPIAKDLSQEFLLDVRHLWLRSRKLTNILKIRSTILKAVRDYFYERGYYEWSPPIITPVACEGGATLFQLKYFDDIAYLTQSWQLYAEAGIFGLEKIFTISPCFRAERSKTSRHLAEFWMAEVETAWQDLDGAIKQAEELVEHVVKAVLKENSSELTQLGQELSKLKKVKTPFPRLTYTQVLELLKKKEGLVVQWGKDLRTIEENKIMKHFDRPLIVTNYPKEIMAFYKPADPRDPKTALCFDMLAPEGYGEIIGGSQRDLDINAMKEALKKSGEHPEHYEWYFDTRRYGSVPHSGFGMGIERVISWICGLDNIKDAIPFPRTMLRKSP
ncbi:MAG: asparagine--tRNA ligase [Candidatus Woesearchaeota archaeon]